MNRSALTASGPPKGLPGGAQRRAGATGAALLEGTPPLSCPPASSAAFSITAF